MMIMTDGNDADDDSMDDDSDDEKDSKRYLYQEWF